MGKFLMNLTAYLMALSILGAGIFLFCALVSLPFWLLWNWLIPDIFGLPNITLLQAFGLWTFIVLLKSSNFNYMNTFNNSKLEQDGTEDSPFGDLSWNQWLEQIRKNYRA
tara:strand:- start:236 stop:565 length:330 start_codon:yes stop_codon:yes gene_type:complete